MGHRNILYGQSHTADIYGSQLWINTLLSSTFHAYCFSVADPPQLLSSTRARAVPMEALALALFGGCCAEFLSAYWIS